MRIASMMLPLALASLTACATSKELEAAKATMNTSLLATRHALESRIQQLEQVKKRDDEQYASQIKRLVTLQEETASHLSEFQRRLVQQHELLQKLGEQVRDTTHDVTEVRAALQSEDGPLAQLLNAEETVYREGLRHVQQIRGKLMNAISRSAVPSNGEKLLEIRTSR